MQKSDKKINVVALSCSPSKNRNSDSMLDYFISGMQKVEAVKVEKVYLNEIPFQHYCYENRNGPREDEEEFKLLTDKIQNAGGLVVATPTYNFSVPAQIKNFIDRIRFFALDFEKQTKLGQPVGRLGYLSTYTLVSGGTPAWAQKILFFAFPPFWLRGVFLYYGAHCLGAIYTGDVETFENKRILLKCKKAGEKYAKKISSGKRCVILNKIFWKPPQINS